MLFLPIKYSYPYSLIHLVVKPDVGEVDEAVDGEGDTETSSFPRARVDLLPRNLQSPQVLQEIHIIIRFLNTFFV